MGKGCLVLCLVCISVTVIHFNYGKGWMPDVSYSSKIEGQCWGMLLLYL